MPTSMNLALMKLIKRAERQDKKQLVDTFVDVGPLFTLLSNPDHQVVFGRRGTGKTHALRYLKQMREAENDFALYIDLRTIGSNNSIYIDTSRSLVERATRLLLDCSEHIYNAILDIAIETGTSEEKILILLERLREQISSVEVVGSVSRDTLKRQQSSSSDELSGGIDITGRGVTATAGASIKDTISECSSTTVREEGIYQTRVRFGGLSKALEAVIDEMPFNKIWLLLDEWAAIPMELQPFLADLVRRAFFPLENIVVKIGAIETRCAMYAPKENFDYLGIELGADAQADINLDDFMVFGNDSEKAETFFLELIKRHASMTLKDESIDISTQPRFLSATFTQRTSLVELVKAAEGVPRDAINIASIAAQKADDRRIAVNHVRTASKMWYDRDKSTSVSGVELNLLTWLVDNVIAGKRSRSFLLEHAKYSQDALIKRLVDARILHVLKRGYSAQDIPGIRFDVYGIDYGCYVDLLATNRAPSTDVIETISGDIQVPDDDYRSIRRAILDLNEFYKSTTTDMRSQARLPI